MTTDPFEILGLPRRFSLDSSSAEARHLELSRALHPDKYASAAAGERRLALSRAIEVNEAWRTLRDPIRRAEAILRIEGLAREIGETREPKAPPDLLMRVLDARERLAEARDSGSAERVAAVRAEARAAYDEALSRLADAIDSALEAGGGAAALRAAIPLLGRLRYAARFLDEAVAAEDHLAGF